MRDDLRVSRAGNYSLRHTALLVAMIVTLPLAALSEGPVTFDRELVRVFISENAFRVEGTYVMMTSAPRGGKQMLLYPFPLDSLHPYPEKISVSSRGRTIAYSRRDDGVTFTIGLAPGVETEFVVAYTQRCDEPRGCYILTSTSAWARPLRRADFEIYVDRDLELDSVSYAPDTSEVTDDYTIYTFSRVGFMPKEDLCVAWRVADGE